jgi:trehalose 6-phosphate synthase
MPNGVQFNGKYCHVGTFPIGIDPEQFVTGVKKPKIKARIEELGRRFSGVKLIVGVDRLDYIKGVPQKMTALELFLEQHPEWIGKVRPTPAQSLGVLTHLGTVRFFPGRTGAIGCSL